MLLSSPLLASYPLKALTWLFWAGTVEPRPDFRTPDYLDIKKSISLSCGNFQVQRIRTLRNGGSLKFKEYELTARLLSTSAAPPSQLKSPLTLHACAQPCHAMPRCEARGVKSPNGAFYPGGISP